MKSNLKTNSVGTFEWVTEEEASLRASDDDPIEAPPLQAEAEPTG